MIVSTRRASFAALSVALALPASAQRVEVLLEPGDPVLGPGLDLVSLGSGALAAGGINAAGDWAVRYSDSTGAWGVLHNGQVVSTGTGLAGSVFPHPASGEAGDDSIPHYIAITESGDVVEGRRVDWSFGATPHADMVLRSGVWKGFAPAGSMPGGWPSGTVGNTAYDYRVLGQMVLDVSPSGLVVARAFASRFDGAGEPVPGQTANALVLVDTQVSAPIPPQVPVVVSPYQPAPGARIEGFSSAAVNDLGAVAYATRRMGALGSARGELVVDGVVQIADGDLGPVPNSSWSFGADASVALNDAGRWAAAVPFVQPTGGSALKRAIVVDGEVLLSPGNATASPGRARLIDGAHPSIEHVDELGGVWSRVRVEASPGLVDVVLLRNRQVVLNLSASTAVDGRTVEAIDIESISSDGHWALANGWVGAQRAALRIEFSIGERYGEPAPNSTGSWADLRAFGSHSVANDDLTFDVAGAPPLALGMLVASRTRDHTPLGGGSQGILLLGTPLVRVQGSVVQTDFGGRCSLFAGPLSGPLADLPVLAGETWHFQFWHRDHGAVFSSNMSNGVSLTFE